MPEPQCHFQCRCGKVYVVKAALSGRTAVCEKCGARTKVPNATASENTIRFPCKCGLVHVLEMAFAGKTAVCKQCGAKTKVPKATAPAFAAAAKRSGRVASRSPFTDRLDETKCIELSDLPLGAADEDPTQKID